MNYIKVNKKEEKLIDKEPETFDIKKYEKSNINKHEIEENLKIDKKFEESINLFIII